MKLPKFSVSITRRIITPDKQELHIELGRWWEIVITRQFIEDTEYFRRGGPRLTGDWQLRRFWRVTKLIKELEVIPFWYGYAYYDFITDTAAYMPIPLNWIRAAWEWLKFHPIRYLKYGTHDLLTVQDSYERGYRDGMQEIENK